MRCDFAALKPDNTAPANGAATLSGIAVETDGKGLAMRVAPVRIGGRLAQAEPDFWG